MDVWQRLLWCCSWPPGSKPDYKGLIDEAVDRVEPRFSPPVHREILIIWAQLMLDEAIDLWMHTATKLGGRKTVRSETFEEHALWRMERRLMNFSDPAALGDRR